MPDTLTVRDNRTGTTIEVPIEHGAVRATAFEQLSDPESGDGLMVYDPAFMNTASCKSTITYIDGERGILLYRGYPIEQLAEHSTYLETAYLLVHAERLGQAQGLALLPTARPTAVAARAPTAPQAPRKPPTPRPHTK